MVAEWTEQNLEENQREIPSNERKVPVGRGRRTATDNTECIELRACVKSKGGHYEHKFSQMFQIVACRTQLFVLANYFNVYQCLMSIYVAVSMVELIFAQQCFTRWWSVWHFLTCHNLLEFVYKNRHFVQIYSKVIPS